MEKSKVESFFEQLLKNADSLKEIKNEKDGVVKSLAQATQKTTHDITLMLLKLEDLGLIKKTFSPNRSGRGEQIISKIKIVKTEFPFKSSKVITKKAEDNGKNRFRATREQAESTPLKNVIPVSLNENGCIDKNMAAVLIDYDNVCGVMIKYGFQISFAKLRDFCRGFGRIIFSDVFLSPPSFNSSKRLDAVNSLWQSGFEVFACPNQIKDKDAVDIKMKARIRKYAEYSSVGKIIIVSEDGDLLHDPEINEFVRDLRKEIITVMPSKHRAELEGVDSCNYISDNINTKVFSKLIEQIFDKNTENLTAENKTRLEFIKEAIECTDEITKGKRFSFMTTTNAVWALLYKKWHKNFCVQDLKAALNALVSTNIMKPVIGNISEKNGNKEFTYYKLNKELTDKVLADNSVNKTLVGK